MNKSSIVIIVLFIIGILFYLTLGKLILPNPFAEYKMKKQAEEYLEENYNDNFEIYGVTDNTLGIHQFDYAAQVRNKINGTKFFIYFNENTDALTDNYAASKLQQDMEKDITSLAKEEFGDIDSILVMIDDNNLAGEGSPDAGSYKQYNFAPTIRISLPKNEEAADKKRVDNLIFELKKKNIIQKGIIILDYIGENEELPLGDDNYTKNL